MDREVVESLRKVIITAIEYVGSANYHDREVHAKYQAERALYLAARGQKELVWHDMGEGCDCYVCKGL